MLLEAHRTDVAVTSDVKEGKCRHKGRGLLEALRKDVAIASDGNIMMLLKLKAA